MLQADQLTAIRGERLVFRAISFEVLPGGALILIGANGSGKSTLLRIVAGLGRVAGGRLLWNSEDALADRTAHARRIAYLGHHDAVKLGFTAAENLRFAARANGASVSEALEQAGLAALAELPARFLSSGQRRRLALARLSLSTAPLWLLDEPTVELDEAAIARLGELLAAHSARGGLIMAATHTPLPLPGAAILRLR